VLLEDLGHDGDGRVDGVGDDQDVGLGGVPFRENKRKSGLFPLRKHNILGNGNSEVSSDLGVGGEEVIAGHALLAGHAGGDDNDIGTFDGLVDGLKGLDLGGGADVREISSNTWLVGS